MGATTDHARAGVVLAGGYSRRFGPTDKALVRVGGRPMLRHVVDRLADPVDEVVVNCRPDQRDRFAAALGGIGARFAVDPPERIGGGPVAGLTTALDAVRAPVAAVAPCDTPRVPPSLLAALFDRADGKAGAVPRDGDRRHPLPAVYRVPDARAACEDVGRDGSLRAVVDRLDPAELVCVADARAPLGSLRGVNTRDDLARLAGPVPYAD